MAEENENNEDINKDVDPDKVDETEAQKLRSWLGRVEKQGKEDRATMKTILEKIEGLSAKPEKPTFGDDEQAKFNEKLHEMILDGKVTDAFNLVNKVNRDAERLIKSSNDKKLSNALGSISEDPVMKNKDLAQEVEAKARELITMGADVNLAVKTAQATVKATALEKMIQSGNANTGSLEMLGASQGKKDHSTTGKKWPESFEKAYQRDKAKGLFKDRADYLDSMTPEIISQYGLSA